MKLTDSFYKIPKPLAECAGFISGVDGKHIELNWMEKAVYSYMLSRNDFFKNKLKAEHFECQVTIGNQLNLDVKMVGKIMRKFMSHQLVDAALVKPKVGQKRYHYYGVKDDLDLWVWEYELTETRHYKKVGKKLLGGGEICMVSDADLFYEAYLSESCDNDEYDPSESWQLVTDQCEF